MFKRKRTRPQPKAPRPVIEEPVQLELPSRDDFRTSLILRTFLLLVQLKGECITTSAAYLTQRFHLLREDNGNLVSYAKFSNALRYVIFRLYKNKDLLRIIDINVKLAISLNMRKKHFFINFG